MSMRPALPRPPYNHADAAWLSDDGGLLAELHHLATYTPGRDEDVYPEVLIRPLAEVSDFIVDELPTAFDAVVAGRIEPLVLFDAIEARAHGIDRTLVPELLANPHSRRTQIAALDIAVAERFANVAHPDKGSYRLRRNASRFYAIGRHLASVLQRYPLHQWSDIGECYPSNDPRTFLSPGFDRLQEIQLYRVQSAIERAAREIVRSWSYGPPDGEAQQIILTLWDGAAKAMANLNRKRQPGEFDKLDRFLSPNHEVVGHGTGSFSSWTRLASYLSTGRESALLSVTLDVNQGAYTPEARDWITRIAQLRPLDPDSGDLPAAIRKRCTDFQIIHRAAAKRHAPGALGFPAPAYPKWSNDESMKRGINDIPNPS